MKTKTKKHTNGGPVAGACDELHDSKSAEVHNGVGQQIENDGARCRIAVFDVGRGPGCDKADKGIAGVRDE